MPEAAPELRHAIDRLVASRNRIFGWGWVADSARRVESVALHAQGDGWRKELEANFGLARDDVASAFPSLVNARRSGFVVTGYLPGKPRTLALDVRFEGGERHSVDIGACVETHYVERRARRVIAWLARAVWRRLSQGDVAGILRRAQAQTYALPTLDDDGVADTLLPSMREAARSMVVLDHGMGGGANQYRQRVIAERVAAEWTVLLCTHNLPTLDYRLELFRPGEAPKSYRVGSFLALERVLDGARVSEILLNSPVSFDEPLLLAEWLARMRAEHPATRLTVTAHDYLPVCPSFVLLDADGRYCGIPDIERCKACLARHTASYVALAPPSKIGPWRALWGRCLQSADEVRCFSPSTKRLLLRAYPQLDTARLSVVPHRVDYAPSRLPRIDHAAPLAIGVIGHISAQKGARIVAEIVERLDRTRSDARVVVIGTLDAAISSPRLVVTGPYERADLPDLVEKHALNAFLFPSVCPETFSYTVEEMIALELPIVAFDLGAPGERLAHYANAKLCPEVAAQPALDALVALHDELAQRAIPA